MALETYFACLEQSLNAHLQKVREQYSHSGIKGAALESSFREVLKDFLPRNLEIGHGEVSDSYGNRSAQCDFVVLSEIHPFRAPLSEPGSFLFDGILAAGEIKASLGTSQLKDSISKAEHFRSLKIRVHKGDEIRMKKPWQNPYAESPPFFLFAFESRMSEKSIVKNLRNIKNRHLDAIFILGKPAMINCYNGRSNFGITFKDGTEAEEWAATSLNPLQNLVVWLSVCMPKIKRNWPLLPEYMNIKSKFE
ncbi:DUF6602 domain-containing protein [Synoicihabitans lomoniglobus]|uniref:DUF6602 domain-containing protein n=1 Tax=Synoicihabitans lomoniglobus TaxID=2909285 RepID=A0AAF0CPX5_9BACT|nr:hypothetical protein [Opitutaceae bacterium LMO-M01]WED65869.1 hypothetical protein PXH66_03280 [Opitutaceae bacterium LMO-M01]